MSPTLFSVLAITLLAIAFAVARGGSPERWCAVIVAAEILVDLTLQLTIGPRSFVDFDLSRMLIDLVIAGGFIVVAMRANRLYPLGIAAAQLVAVIGSLSALLAHEGWSQAFWAMTQLPIFLQVGLLVGGTLAHQHRLAILGPYNCWSRQDLDFRQPA